MAGKGVHSLSTGKGAAGSTPGLAWGRNGDILELGPREVLLPKVKPRREAPTSHRGDFFALRRPAEGTQADLSYFIVGATSQPPLAQRPAPISPRSTCHRAGPLRAQNWYPHWPLLTHFNPGATRGWPGPWRDADRQIIAGAGDVDMIATHPLDRRRIGSSELRRFFSLLPEFRSLPMIASISCSARRVPRKQARGILAPYQYVKNSTSDQRSQPALRVDTCSRNEFERCSKKTSPENGETS